MTDYKFTKQSRLDLWFFLILVTLGSLSLDILILRENNMETRRILILILMWIPGMAALGMKKLFSSNPIDIGWHIPRFRYLAIAYCLPILGGTAVYTPLWLSGLAQIDLSRVDGLVGAVTLALSGVLVSISPVMGEEIGWRGYFLPRLVEILPYHYAVVINGIVWVIWHTPLIWMSNFTQDGAPIWYGWICYSMMVMGTSFSFSWLRVRSGSLWPPILLHASHNLFIQAVFDRITLNSQVSTYLTGEFGAGLALFECFTAGVFLWLEARNGLQPDITFPALRQAKDEVVYSRTL